MGQPFTIVEEDEAVGQATPVADLQQALIQEMERAKAATALANRDALASRILLKKALGALSERAIAGLSALFSLVGLGSVWFLWMQILGEPKLPQLIGMGMYCIFLLILEIVRRKM